MEENKTLIPPTVTMMDAGLARYEAADETAAVETVVTLLEKHGGKQIAREGSLLTYSFSNAFKLRYMTVLVESSDTLQPSSGPLRPFVAMFREGNASSELMHYCLLLAALLVMGALCWILHSWWSLLACPVVIALYLWLQYAPEKAYIRKIVRIRKELEG